MQSIQPSITLFFTEALPPYEPNGIKYALEWRNVRGRDGNSKKAGERSGAERGFGKGKELHIT